MKRLPTVPRFGRSSAARSRGSTSAAASGARDTRTHAVESALQHAASLGLLDDAAFARNYVQTRTARGRGPSRLVADLLAMGVERSLIDRAVAAEWGEGTDRSTVPQALAEARAARLRGLPRSRSNAGGCWPIWRAGVSQDEKSTEWLEG